MSSGMLTAMAVAPLTVITGNEELLVERALKRLITEAGLDVEVVEISARAVQPGQLTVAASPSLFGGAPVVVVNGIEALVQSSDEVAAALDEVMAVRRSTQRRRHGCARARGRQWGQSRAERRQEGRCGRAHHAYVAIREQCPPSESGCLREERAL